MEITDELLVKKKRREIESPLIKNDLISPVEKNFIETGIHIGGEGGCVCVYVWNHNSR